MKKYSHHNLGATRDDLKRRVLRVVRESVVDEEVQQDTLRKEAEESLPHAVVEHDG
jgi:hypothetical protein